MNEHARSTRAPQGHIPQPHRLRQALLSSARVGSTNRGVVMQALYDLGPTSRAELARMAGVNRTTISGIVQPLIDQKILAEIDAEPARPGGGKPARPLWFSPDAPLICGLLLMPDAVHSCVTTLDGKTVTEHRRALPDSAGPTGPLFDAIAECIGETLGEAKRRPIGIGVAVGGMVDTDRGEVIQINLAPALNGYPLASELERRFGIPVRLDHHPRALLVGDRWFGKGRGLRQFAVIYTGEVLGGAMFFDGHLYRGVAGAGGELGHTFVQLDGELCRCGQRGCWDTIATLGWLRRAAHAARLPEAEAIDSRRLADLVARGVPGAEGVFDSYARNIAVGIANLQQTVAPNHFILHGDVVLGGEPLISRIAAHVYHMVPQRPHTRIAIEAGDAGDEAALLGAAGLVLSDVLQFSV